MYDLRNVTQYKKYRRNKKQEKINKQKIYNKSDKFASKLRKAATKAENILKKRLKQENIVFDFQKPIIHNKNFRIVDFYFPRGKLLPLVVELDGSSHIGKQQDDLLRENFLKEAINCEILRFRNEQVYKELDNIIYSIKSKHVLMMTQT